MANTLARGWACTCLASASLSWCARNKISVNQSIRLVSFNTFVLLEMRTAIATHLQIWNGRPRCKTNATYHTSDHARGREMGSRISVKNGLTYGKQSAGSGSSSCVFVRRPPVQWRRILPNAMPSHSWMFVQLKIELEAIWWQTLQTPAHQPIFRAGVVARVGVLLCDWCQRQYILR